MQKDLKGSFLIWYMAIGYSLLYYLLLIIVIAIITGVSYSVALKILSDSISKFSCRGMPPDPLETLVKQINNTNE